VNTPPPLSLKTEITRLSQTFAYYGDERFDNIYFRAESGRLLAAMLKNCRSKAAMRWKYYYKKVSIFNEY
jgi:hypothetical protein